MYKNPELSEKAKRLRAVLTDLGLQLSHAQSMEACSRLDGARTLHVAQAKGAPGSAASAEDALAHLRNVTRQYRQMHDWRLRHECEDPEPGAEQKETVHRMALAIAMAKAEEFLAADNGPAPATTAEEKPLFEGPMLDWAIHDGMQGQLLEHQLARYAVKVQRSSSQFFVDIVPEGAGPQDLSGKNQMSLFIEINDGLPCVHISNDVQGDQVLTVFSTSDGLYLRPNDGDQKIRSSAPDPVDAPSLLALHQRETANVRVHHNAHISSSNRYDT